MNCREFQFSLDEYVVGRLAPERRIPMDAHRAACAVCKQAYQEETAFRSQLREMPVSVASHDLWNQVAAQIAQPVAAPVRSLWRRWTFAALVPAASFAALAFFLISRTPQPTPPDVVLTPASYEQKVVNEILEMRRMDVAERDGLIELTTPENRGTTEK